MGKLVLGIFAVSLLQIAFFMYTATSEPSFSDVSVVRNAREKDPQLRAANDLPEVVVPPPPVDVPATRLSERKPSASLRESRETLRSSSTQRAAVRTVSSLRVQHRSVRPKTIKPSVVYLGSRKSSAEASVRPMRAAPTIPKGYSMVLVDYVPPASKNRTKDISEPKKRSYLARTVPALVKKPWKWMKALASKLN